MTPTETTDQDSLQLVRNLWEFVGAVPHLLSPETHDLLIGAASHLPHLIAQSACQDCRECGSRAAESIGLYSDRLSGFHTHRCGVTGLVDRHFHPNRDVLLSLIDDIADNLNQFKTLLQTENLTEIERLLLEAQVIVEKRRKALGGS